MGECSQVISTLIYTASTLHAAVNFPQRPSMSFNPSCPGSVYQPIPTDKVMYRSYKVMYRSYS